MLGDRLSKQFWVTDAGLKHMKSLFMEAVVEQMLSTLWREGSLTIAAYEKRRMQAQGGGGGHKLLGAGGVSG